MLSRLAVLIGSAAALNDRPIIGVFTEPHGVELSKLGDNHYNQTYIAASYVRFAESAGARVVPVHFDASDDDLKTLFGQINGLIFPGGGTSFSKGTRFREAAQLLLNLALAANDRGDPFPIHGTCLGFQLLHSLVADDESVLCVRCYKTEGTPLPLNFTTDARKSKLFSEMSPALYKALGTDKITENSHSSGVNSSAYSKSKKLADFFEVLSTNEDTDANEFVSTVEAKHYPISASQWHPEKNNFEWGKIGKTYGYEAIPHSADAVLLSQYMANDFVNRARHSEHRFKTTEDESRALIYNVPAVPDPQGYFAEVYLWQDREGKRIAHTPSVIV